jgi:NAD(P)-dependent dehydrogenase (short-subunit alcohol dehydrogenase family)
MSFGPDDLPDLTGTRAVVTGATSGIGLVTARELAAHGAQVVLAVRDTETGHKVAAGIAGDPRVEHLDLASQASVADFAERFEGPLDLLVNNAGVMTPPRYRETEDGHELQFGTNHLGHFALTARLLPRLQESTHPRVVTVSSVAHHRGDDSVLQGNPEATYAASKDYGNSKLANLLFALELHRRAQAAGSHLVSTACHPGVSATGLVEDPNGMGANPVVRRIAKVLVPLVMQPAAAGANPTLYAATRAEPGSYSGPQGMRETRGRVGAAKLSRWARDEDLARRLWEVSEQKTGLTLTLD